MDKKCPVHKFNVLMLILIGVFLSLSACKYPRNQAVASCNFLNNSYQFISWDQDDLPITFYVSSTVPIDFQESIKSAASSWNNSLKRQVLVIQITDKDLTHRKNLRNTITIQEQWDEVKNSEQGITSVYWAGTEIIESDIQINNFNFSYYSSKNNKRDVLKAKLGPSDIYSFEALILHELGHALGLMHNNIPESIMNTHLAANTDRDVPSQIEAKNFNCGYSHQN